MRIDKFERIVGAGLPPIYRLTVGVPCMMRRLIEYRAVMVRMPARSGWIFIFVCRNAVTHPQIAPATIERSRPRFGMPATVIMAQTAAPVTNDPSTVKSGESIMLTVMYSPKERTAKTRPSWIAFRSSVALINSFPKRANRPEPAGRLKTFLCLFFWFFNS